MGADRRGVVDPPSAGGSAPVVAEVRRRLGLTRKTFSRLTGYSERTIADWESGRKPSESSRQRIAEIERLRSALARVVKPDFIAAWLAEPNEGFGGLKPLEVIERGESDRIWRMIFYLESGVAS